MTVLGIDLGTQSVKVAAVDDEGAVLAAASRPYEVSSPRPGWAEAEPDAWLDATVDAAREVIDGLPERPRVVGLSGQMHGVVLCDGQGSPLRSAITWADSRSGEQAARIRADLGDAQLSRLGSAPFPGFAGPTLAWLSENEPDVLRSARWALQPKDWLRLRLTGEAATDPSDASGTLVYDIVDGRWSPEALAACGVQSDLLPDIAASTDLAGVIDLHGGALAGLPVVVGGADAACGIVGLGLRPGEGAIALGTGAQLSCVLDRPLIDPTLRTHTFASAGSIGESWYRLGAVQSGGLALERSLSWLGASVAEAQDALAAGIQESDPIFWPFVAGERSPFIDPDLRSSWRGLSLGTTREAMLRSVMEGMAYVVGSAYSAVVASGAQPSAPIICLGGGSRDAAYVRLLASVLGVPLMPAAVGDATVVGAARLAGDVYGRDIPPAGVLAGAVIEPRREPLVEDRYRAWLDGVEGSRVS